jgi:hypothetical protein
MARDKQSPAPAPVGGSSRHQTNAPDAAEQAELDKLEQEMRELEAAEGEATAGPLVVAPGRTLHYAGPNTEGKTVKFSAGDVVPFSDAEIALGEPERLKASGHLVAASAGAGRVVGVSESGAGEGARVSVSGPDAAA